MTHDTQMTPLLHALNERKNAGKPVRFWLRDDDAVEPTKPLDELLTLTNQYGVPLTLAVIPAHATDALAQQLTSINSITVAVHGWSHQNYAPADEKKQELGLHRPLNEIRFELKRGYTVLAEQYASHFVPLLVPPWNRIDPTIIEELPELGFQGLSTFGDATSRTLAIINTHVDIIDWKGTRGGRNTPELVNELVEIVETTQIPIGILTHHLVHDDVAWQFLRQLFSVTSTHPGATWVSVNQLLPGLPPDPGLPREEQS